MESAGCEFYKVDWATLAAWVTALAAIVALYIEHRRFRLSQSVDLLLKFEDKFGDSRVNAMRAKAARAYRKGDQSQVDDVLDELETVGLLAKKRVLDYEMIWSTFGYLIIMYAYVWKDYITESQKKDPEVWTYFVSLAKKVKAIEAKTHGALRAVPTRQEVQDFIKNEMSLK